MSDGQTVSVEVEAKALGWAPREEWRGPPDRWVDAETFVERGHSVMPILKKNNQDLMTKLGEQQREIERLKDLDRVRGETIKNLTAFQAAEVKRQVEEQVTELKLQKRQAIKDGDHDLAADLDEKLDEAKERAARAVVPAAPAAPTPVPASTPAIEPWAQEFATENDSWLQKDKKRTAVFVAAADELQASGLRGKALLDAAKREMESVFAPAPSPSKVEGGGGSPSSGGGGSSRAKGFSDLPADAREVCRSQARQFVGEKKAFATEADWQKHYASVYFASE